MKKTGSKLSVRLLSFLIIAALIFWLTPVNMIMGEDAAQGSEVAASEATAASDTAAETTVQESAVSETTVATDTQETAQDMLTTESQPINDSSEQSQQQSYSASLNVVANPEAVIPGENAVFKIVVKNTGTMPLEGINVVYKLPELAVFTPIEGLGFNQELREVSFSINNLNAGEELLKDITVGIPAVVSSSVELINNFKMSSGNIQTVEKSVVLSVQFAAEDPLTQNTDSYSPFIYSDKEDYHPGEEVTIFGEGFVPNEEIQIVFYAITPEIPGGEVEHTGTVNNIGENGKFVYRYSIVGAEKYKVEARSIVKNEDGQTEVLKSDSLEINSGENTAMDNIILGSLIAWTVFTDSSITRTPSTGAFTMLQDNPFTEDSGNGASYWVKYDNWYHEFVGTFPYSGFASPCGGDIILTEVLIKTGPYLLAFYPGGSTKYWDRDDEIGLSDLPNKARPSNYSVSFSGTGSVTVSEKNGAKEISHVEYYFKCAPVQLGSIEVTKTGLEGSDQANLTLKDSKGNTVATSPQKVSNNGKATWLNLAYGTYTVVEDFTGITNTYTYNVSNPMATIKVDSTTKETKTISNCALKGSIEVKKMGLEGSDHANLTLKDSKGNTVATSPQKVSNGEKASWSNLAYGTYTVVEDFSGITNTHTYNVSNPMATIIVNSTTKVSKTITNTEVKFGSIEVTKMGLEGSDHANLTLKDSNGNTVATSPQKVSNGEKASWSKLAYGTYTVVEDFSGITNTYTYNVSNPMATIVVDSTCQETKTITNCALKGSIEITKMGLQGSDHANLTLKDSNGNTVATSPQKVSNGEKASWSKLAYGTYTVVEDFSGITNTYTYNVSNPMATIVVDSTTKVSKTITNNPNLGSIVVTKTGMMGTDKVSITLKKGSSIIETKTEVTDGTYTFSGLVFGNDYSITETYKTGNTYTYGVATQDPANNINVASATAVAVSLTNNPNLGSIVVTKTGMMGSDLVSITLKKGSEVIKTETEVGNGTYTFSGLVFGSDYSITEEYKDGNTYTYAAATQVPANDVKVESAAPVSVALTNNPNLGSISLVKSSSSNLDLKVAGAVYGLFFTNDLSKPVLDILGSPITETTDNNGFASFGNLEYKTYFVKELSAPAGYKVDPDFHEITIPVAATINVAMVVTDDPVDIYFTKTFTGLTTTLSTPAVFNIYLTTDTATPVKPAVSLNAAGEVRFSVVSPGTYVIVETVPSGYYAMPDIYVTVGTDETVVYTSPQGLTNGATVVNTPIPPYVPPVTPTTTPDVPTTPILTVAGITEAGGIQVLAFTGIDPIIPISGAAAIIAGLAMLVATLVRRNSRKLSLAKKED